MAVFSLPVRNLISLSFSAASITRKELKLWWSGNISEDLCPYFHCSTVILWTSVQYFDTMIQFEDLNFLQQRDILLIETHFLVFWHFFFIPHVQKLRYFYVRSGMWYYFLSHWYRFIVGLKDWIGNDLAIFWLMSPYFALCKSRNGLLYSPLFTRMLIAIIETHKRQKFWHHHLTCDTRFPCRSDVWCAVMCGCFQLIFRRIS